jgi:DNA-binding HxlR family transcriptional regulator
MRISEIGKMTCPVARAVDIVGDPWMLMIIRELFLGSRRFDQFETYLGLSPRLLSARMRTLVSAGIVRRTPYQERPKRYEYRLTAKGLDLWPVIMALRTWGDRWGEWPAGKPSTLRHDGCGQLTTVEHHCAACGGSIGPGDVTLEQSPAALAERTALAEGHAVGEAV